MSDTMYVYDTSEDNINNLLTNYWQSYDLKQSPFDESPQFAMYYPLPNWQTHLQFLHEFCFGNHPLMLVEGELGIGKSLLITQFLEQLDSQITPCEIKGRATTTGAQLIANIAQGFQLPLVLSQPTLREQMNAELALLRQQQKIRLLIIDDADLLPTETLAALVHLACSQNRNQIHLYIILSCELRLHNHLENLAQEQNHPLYIPSITLTPLNFEETKQYLKYRLHKAGLTGKFPFTKEMIESIYQLSSGVPGRINRVAQQSLIDLLKSSGTEVPGLQHKREQWWALIKNHPIKIISFACLIILMVVFVKLIDVQRSSLVIGAAKHKSRPVQTLTIKPITPPPPSLPKKTPITKIVKPAPAPALAAPAPNIETQTITAKVEKNFDQAKLAAATNTRDEKKLLAMQGYTLQILGAWTMADLQQFISANNLNKSKVFTFKTQFKGKPWYVLVYGNYSTPEQAKAATKQLPKKLQKLHPWVRPLTSVHQAIKNPA